MPRLVRFFLAAFIATLVAIPAALVSSAPAEALNGVCGFYNESRAYNTFCRTSAVRSWVGSRGMYYFGPFASLGRVSSQNQNFAAIDFASYQVRLNF